MFTIKLIINGDTLLTESPVVTIGRAGSSVLAEALSLTAQHGPLDVFQFFPPTYSDEACTITELRGFEIAVPRDGMASAPLAVVVTDEKDTELSSAPGTSYQFIYPGDQVFVMNDNGQTVELVK